MPATTEQAYLFRHAIVREAAYELQVPADRARLHAWAVRVLEGDALAAPLDLANHAALAAQAEQDIIDVTELHRLEIHALQQGAEAARRQYDAETELECLQRLGDHPALPKPDQALHLLNQHRPLISLGRMEQSIAACEAAAKRARGDLAARALARLSEVNLSIGRIDAARIALAKALDIPADDPETGALVRLSEGRLALRAMDLAKAERCLLSSESIGREAGALAVAASAMDVLAILYRTREEYSVALEWLDRLDAMSSQYPEHRSRATHMSRGNILWRLSRWDDSQEQFELALQTARQRGDLPEQAIAMGNLGNVYMERGRVGKAREYHEQAIAMCTELGLTAHLALYTLSLGNSYQKLGDAARAFEQYDKAEAQYRAIGNLDDLSGAIANKGIVHMDAGRYEQALCEFKRAESVARDTGNMLRVASHISRRADLCKRRGDFEGAARDYAEALSLRRSHGADVGRTDALLQIHLTWSLVELERREEAMAGLSLSQAYAEQCRLGFQDLRETTAGALNMLRELEQKLGAG